MLKLDLSSCKNVNIGEAPFFFPPSLIISWKEIPQCLTIVDLSFGGNFTRLLNIKKTFSLLKILYEDYHFQKTHQKELK